MFIRRLMGQCIDPDEGKQIIKCTLGNSDCWTSGVIINGNTINMDMQQFEYVIDDELTSLKFIQSYDDPNGGVLA